MKNKQLITLSERPEKEQKFCFAQTPHKFSHDYSKWAFDPQRLPICQFCGVIDDRQQSQLTT